jgi:hypothetical protein
MSATSVGFLAGPLLAAPLDQGTAFLIAAALLAAAGALGVTAPQWRRRELTQEPGAQRGIEQADAKRSRSSLSWPASRSSHSVRLWLQFSARPTRCNWYRAHNASIVAGYLEHRGETAATPSS